MKLVFVYCWGDEGCSGVDYIPFEYTSKDEFIFDMLNQFNDEYWEKEHGCYILDVPLRRDEFLDLGRNIFTLDKWFENYKRDI